MIMLISFNNNNNNNDDDDDDYITETYVLD